MRLNIGMRTLPSHDRVPGSTLPTVTSGWKSCTEPATVTVLLFFKLSEFQPWHQSRYDTQTHNAHAALPYTFKYIHSKKSPSIVKLRSFQNASIEIKQISFVYQQNLFPVTKLICEMKKENIFTNEWLFLSLKRNPLII